MVCKNQDVHSKRSHISLDAGWTWNCMFLVKLLLAFIYLSIFAPCPKGRWLHEQNQPIHSYPQHSYKPWVHLHCGKVVNLLWLIQIHLKWRCLTWSHLSNSTFWNWIFEFEPVYSHHKTEIDCNLSEVDDDLLPSVNQLLLKSVSQLF